MGKVCFETRGLADLGGGSGGNKLTLGKKKLFPAEKQTFPSPRGLRNRLVSGSGNKGFAPERVFSGQEN